jgi:hypothetical protein
MGKTTLLNHIAQRILSIPPNIDVLLCEQGIDFLNNIRLSMLKKFPDFTNPFVTPGDFSLNDGAGEAFPNWPF